MQRVVDSVDLVNLVSQYTTLSRSLNGPCVLCGGRDRFFIRKDRRHFGCRKCDFNGDAIDFACGLWHMTFYEAIEALSGFKPTREIIYSNPAPVRTNSTTWMDYGWQERILLKIAHMRSAMQRGDNQGLRYLMSRGLSEQSIKDYQLGFNPSCFDPIDEQGRPAISLPYLMNGDITLGVKYRYIDDLSKDNGRRFRAEKGGNPILFGLHLHSESKNTLVAIEGELNAISIHQAIPEVNVLSFGSDTNPEGVRQISLLASRHERSIVWMDDPHKLSKVMLEMPKETIGIQSIVAGRWRSQRSIDANDFLQSKGPVGLRAFVLAKLCD